MNTDGTPVSQRRDFLRGRLRLYPSDQGGVDFPIPNGWISGLLRFGEAFTDQDSLFGCEVRFPGREALQPGEEGEVEIRTIVDPRDYPHRLRGGASFDFWHGRDIGEGFIQELVVSDA